MSKSITAACIVEKVYNKSIKEFPLKITRSLNYQIPIGLAFLMIGCSNPIDSITALISPSPIPTQSVSTTTKKVTKTLPINVSTTKYVYPSEAIANYVDVCTKAGGMKGSCTCFIEKVQNNYALDELVRLNQEIAKGAKPPKSLIKINEQCEQEQLKQMGEALGKMIPTHK